MATEENVRDARDQLNLVLSFFPRVDAKLSTVLAINTAMLGALGAMVPPIQTASWPMAITPVLTVIALGFSYFFLYRGGFPVTKGGYASLIYFKNIADRNEASFIAAYANLSTEELRSDILAQVWRNSQILSAKFNCLRSAFVAMALGVLPWMISLCVFALHKK